MRVESTCALCCTLAAVGSRDCFIGGRDDAVVVDEPGVVLHYELARRRGLCQHLQYSVYGARFVRTQKIHEKKNTKPLDGSDTYEILQRQSLAGADHLHACPGRTENHRHLLWH